MRIKHINAYEILASGGYPSIECRIELENGSFATASVPYGASAGSHEATVLLDGDTSRFHGKGMLKAVDTINSTISNALKNKDFTTQALFDRFLIELDGTENKENLGGNTILAASLAFAKTVARYRNQELFTYIIDEFNTGVHPHKQLPNPMMVTIEGGKHADNSTDIQEYCLTGMSSEGPTKNIEKVIETYHEVKIILKELNYNTNVGNEGAFAPAGITENEKPLEILTNAISKAGYTTKTEIGISLDIAASEFYTNGIYNLGIDNKELNSQQMSEYLRNWFEKYPAIVTLEDGHNEDDWEGWSNFKKVCEAHNVELIGDDLTVTNKKRLQKAIDKKAITSILIKLNQIGSLTETVETCLLAKENNMMTVPSHRGGGETNDTSMVDLAVAVGSRFIKVGPTRGERVVKYNRLMEIERITNN